MEMIEARIARKTPAAQDIVELELRPLESEALPSFTAGAHIDLEIRPGLVRQYSLCNDPDERHRYVLGVLRDPGSRGGSVAVHDELQEGQVLRIGAPRNLFPLVPARRALLFAGGIGITPILCMAERLSRVGADFELHYCARSPERAAFLERIRAAAFADRVGLHFDDGDVAQRLDLPAVLAMPEADTHLYVCGPRGFIDHVTGTAAAMGWGAAQIHVEHFGAVTMDASANRAFQVKVASRGQTVIVPADKTIVQALAAEGIDIPVACEQGVCGTCLTRVLEGEPDHRDSFLTDEEKAANDMLTPCCSRARSGVLVLDL